MINMVDDVETMSSAISIHATEPEPEGRLIEEGYVKWTPETQHTFHKIEDAAIVSVQYGEKIMEPFSWFAFELLMDLSPLGLLTRKIQKRRHHSWSHGFLIFTVFHPTEGHW